MQQAIELSSDLLKDVRLLREVAVVKDFLEHIARDTGKAVYGIQDFVRAIDMSAADTILVWEDHPCIRYVFVDSEGN